jgi:hypothetical protein
MTDLKQFVTEYLDVSQKLSELMKETKDLNQNKKTLSEAIIHMMNESNVDACKLQNGDALVLKTTVRYESLKPEFVQTNLESFFVSKKHECDHPAVEATSHIMNAREETTSQSLKIVKNK